MLVVLTLVALADVALGTWLLARRPGRPIDLARVGATALACAAFLALQCAGVRLLGRTIFLCIQLAYLMALFAMPACALLVLAMARRRPVTAGARRVAAASLLVVPIALHATFVEPFRLELERAGVELDPARAPERPLRLGVLADIQCMRVTDRERAAVARVLAEAPELILLPGDLMQLGPRSLDEAEAEFRDLLRPLDAPLGVYFVLGDTDSRGAIERVIAGTRVQLLDNRIVRLRHGAREVLVGGVDLLHRGPEARAVLEELERAPGEELRLLVAHRPDVVLALGGSGRVDLVVAGHTHGGQVVLPGFGPLITQSRVPRAVAAGGLHQIGEQRIYVSRGIGCERGHAPRVRLFCPPEITLLTLAAAGEP